ncbi:septal ring lytic transglycosylase RlpA family protein [Flavobacterium sp.]|uniref:septal ring lytic transglycosylase RlpA family protein n=1 Tax=Flavobacterium sp. TaxID=239 RepID=UPI00378EA1A6
MKKIVTLFLSVLIIGLTNGQSLHKRKHKSSSQKDSIKKSKTLVEKEDKSVLLKDTIDKNKTLLIQQEPVLDTLSFEMGKLKTFKKNAHASYYADKFNGKRTTSGKRFDNNKFTAAHKKLPFGTKIKVTNQANGKSVIVEVIDRGPFVRSREIDLSKRAFMQIASIKSSGSMIVTIEVEK